jgi:histidinol dehydrogenase
MKLFNTNQQQQYSDFIAKKQQTNKKIANIATKIINNIRLNGDSAILDYCRKFDQTTCQTTTDLLVSANEIADSTKLIDNNLKQALDFAYDRIYAYHTKQLPSDFDFTDNLGVKLGNHWRAIKHIGIYVPGGTASYPSSVLMSAVPAIVAGVNRITMFMPGKNTNPAVLYAAKICGINTIYKIGGAQAIAAMAFGSQTINKVNKIVGPGNAFVAAAKKIVYGDVGIDMVAGPTDICIIADNTANAKWLACDALSQLEHGSDSQAFLITTCSQIAKDFLQHIKNISKKLDRYEIIKKSCRNSAVFLLDNLQQAAELANTIAPEHLQLVVAKPRELLKSINNAGAIFLGNYTPEAIGDYTAGPSHTLPTFASANFSSGLSVYDFLKRMSIIECDEQAFNNLAEATATIAKAEGLTAHKLSIDIRKTT